jgi:hypothetical protein
VIPFVLLLRNKRVERGGTRFVAPPMLRSVAAIAEHDLTPPKSMIALDAIMPLG